MKKIFLGLLLVLSVNAFGGTDDTITIDGVIGSNFDKDKVQVYDSLNQTFFLPRKLLPKGVQVKAGSAFTIEMKEADFDKLDVKPSDKKIKTHHTVEKK